jgi:hypothetical protein
MAISAHTKLIQTLKRNSQIKGKDMSLNFNKDMFTALSQGNGFQSTTTDISAKAKNKAGQLKSKLDNYINIVNQLDTSSLTTSISTKLGLANTTLEAYDDQVVMFQLHLESRIDGFLEDMQVAAAIKEIDSYIQQVPASCANINTIAGTLTGVADVSLDSCINLMLDFEGGLDALDFAIQMDNNDDINVALVNLGVKIDTLTNDLNTQINYLGNIVSAEVDALRGMYETHNKMAKTFALQSLLEDECVKGLISQLAGDTLKTAIKNKLEAKLEEELVEPFTELVTGR